jgi:hypothetical protein
VILVPPDDGSTARLPWHEAFAKLAAAKQASDLSQQRPPFVTTGKGALVFLS